MADSAGERGEMIRYLLGDSSEKERLRIESGYFGDPECYQRLLEVEDELTYRWVRGELAGAQRERFGKRLLASEAGREKAAFAEALTAVATRLSVEEGAGARSTSWWSPWLPIAAGLVIALFAWQVVQLRQLRIQVSGLHAQLEAGRKNQAASDLRAAAPAPPALTIPFFLSPGLTRGTDHLRQLQIPANAASVRLQLVLKEGTTQRVFQAVVRTVAGREVWNLTGLHAAIVGTNSMVEIDVPTSVLANDEYDVILQGQRPGRDFEELGTYHFGIVR